MPAFEQTSFLFPERKADESAKALQVASQAAKITQELRRPRPEAPRISTRELGPADDERVRQDLEHRISAHLPGGRLALAVTDNRYTMISVKREKGPMYRVRLHHMFLKAPPAITRSLARYIAMNDSEASKHLSAFIDEHHLVIRRAARRQRPPVTVETCGEVYDLQEVFDSLNGHYFGSQIDACITWGPRGGKRKRRRSIKMGSYSVEDRLIRVHPALDRRFIPRYFLEWIVYHEMLHQVHDIPVVGGRRQFHTPQFLAQERQFDHYDRARRWERTNLDRILHY
ncbi:MAG: hypothetical protein HY698_21225 [Deltaproteobacteria bacterium]|nr:hypothetical protein [Deltaproteobacteria bacterium]